MIELYTREGCGSCARVKERLKAMNVQFEEKNIDEHKVRVKENYPHLNALPIVVVDGFAYSGAPEIEKMLNEYKEDFGKELLNE